MFLELLEGQCCGVALYTATCSAFSPVGSDGDPAAPRGEPAEDGPGACAPETQVKLQAHGLGLALPWLLWAIWGGNQ